MATTFLPNAAFAVGGTVTAEALNDFKTEPRELTLTVAAKGALVPVMYGRRDAPGLMFAQGMIGSDLVIGFLWCVGEIDAIEAIYVNDALPPMGAGNVVITNYLGTPSQGVDATLASAIAGYADTLRVPIPGGGFLGLAYSVLRIPPGKISGFPRTARAVIRGRKVYDPRTATTAYSANSALCMGDLITNPVFGLGRTVLGLAECADWDDSLLGGVSGAYRARLALILSEGRKAESYLDLLGEYAECFYTYEGTAIRMIPNAPVDLDTVGIVGPGDYIEDTLRPVAESSSDTPTVIDFQYTEIPTTTTQPWALTTQSVPLPGVTSGDVQRIPTSVPMEGVTSATEAANKATARLNRMQSRLRYSWVTKDIGVVHQRGDVVRIQAPKEGIDNMPVRIMKIRMNEPGRYGVEAERYDPSHYPSDIVLPGDDGIVPVGAIALLVGTDVPAGWELYATANGKYIVGAGSTYAVGANGVATAGPWSSSVTGGAHSGSDDTPGPGVGSTAHTWPKPGTFAPAGEHTHNYTVSSVTENILRRENILVRKITAPAINIPASVRVLGVANVITPASKNTGFAGRLLLPAASNANAGVSTQAATAITFASGNDGHTHHPNNENFWETFGGVGTEAQGIGPAGGTHTHTCNVVPVFNPKRKQLCVYESAIDYTPRPGMVFMWAGSIGSLPTDYALCDGANGTPDMRDRFLEFGDTAAAAPTGDNTMRLTGTSSEVGHSHNTGGQAVPAFSVYGHSATVYHSHTLNQSVAYVPKYYALAFIMYVPGV